MKTRWDRLRQTEEARAWLEWWATAIGAAAELSESAQELLGRPGADEAAVAGVIGREDLAGVLEALAKLSERLAAARPRLRLFEARKKGGAR